MDPIFEIGCEMLPVKCVAIDHFTKEYQPIHGLVFVCKRESIPPLTHHKGIYDRERDVVYFPFISHISYTIFMEMFDQEETV